MSPIEKDPSAGFNAAVAVELRAERAARQITIDELAARSDVPKRTLIRLLNAERAVNVEHLHAIAHALGCSARDIMARAQQRADSTPPAWELAAQHQPGIEDDEAAL